MIRIIYTAALCGALLCTAIPAHAEELPAPAPALPSAARPTNLVTDLRTAPRQVGAGDQVTATAAVSAAVPITAAQALSTPTGTQPITTTTAVTGTPALTGTAALTASEALSLALPTPTAALTASVPATTTNALTPTGIPDPALDQQYTGVLEGTIIANRTEANVRFFVEGQVYDLVPLRAIGLPLPRATGVLNLFNCDAVQSAEGDAGCFWDPYLLKQDGFYEVVTGAEAGALVNLSLREAGAPPANQIWVQNRTGERQSIIVNNETVEIAPASVQQFTFDGPGPVAIYLRNCITQGAQTACEWAPQGVDLGYYYALVKLTSMGANSATVTTDKLEAVVASSGEVVDRPAEASCVLRVPTLNVRGGPGLEYPVIAKVRGSDTQPGSVVVVGFDATEEWMQVVDSIAPGGWVTSNPDFIMCTGDMALLPVAGAPAGANAEAAATPEEQAAAEATTEAVAETPVEPTAEAVAEAPVAEEAPADQPVVEEVPVEAAPAEEATAETTEAAPDATPAPAGIPTGLARLVVNNGFDQVVRFTLDQKYRVELDNLSGEWDLQPGQSISILVYPNMIPFTVSTPWRGLSDNADVTVEADQERALWLYFIPDPDGSGSWILQF